MECNIVIIFTIIVIIILIIIKVVKKCKKETFNGTSELYKMDKNPIFVNLYDNNGTKLNVTLISKPFFNDEDFKQFLVNKPNRIYLGITSYMEFPGVPSNPNDDYIDLKLKKDDDKYHPHYLDMYHDICEGWLHCFRDPYKYLPKDKPLALISESDFVDFKSLVPNKNIKKEYDYIYSCPKVNDDKNCDDWVSYNKNWKLGQKCIYLLSEKLGLKGLLVGRKYCNVPENCEVTGWVEYGEMIELYKKSKFVFLPNIADASPRVLTECLSLDLPCLVNYNILGGWKYVNKQTGVFFNDENNVVEKVKELLNNYDKYEPRKYIIENYGHVKSGKKLAEFLFKNFKDRLNVKEEDVKYITLRSQYKE